MTRESILGIWHPTEKTLTGFKMLHGALAKENTLLESGIYTLQNGDIQHQYPFDKTLFSDCTKKSLDGLSIAFFCPPPIGYLNGIGAIPMHSIGRVAVACLGVIDNLSEIQEKLIFYGYEFNTNNVAETLCYLFSSYLKIGYISPIEAMQVVMKSLKGHFALMVLVAKGKWLMVGCRDYPLVIGKNDPTVYFGTDAETLALFSPSKTSVHGKKKPEMFCATLYQSELIVPVHLL